MRRVGIILLVFSFLCAALLGKSFAATGLTAGLPSLPCSEIVEKKEDVQMRDWIRFWTTGFWTGLNVANSFHGVPLKNLRHPSVKRDAFEARLLAYCYESPNAVLIQIAIVFFQKLPKLPAGLGFGEE